MRTLTLRLLNEQHERLKTLTVWQSLNRLFEEISAKSLAEFEVEMRVCAGATREPS